MYVHLKKKKKSYYFSLIFRLTTYNFRGLKDCSAKTIVDQVNLSFLHINRNHRLTCKITCKLYLQSEKLPHISYYRLKFQYHPVYSYAYQVLTYSRSVCRLHVCILMHHQPYVAVSVICNASSAFKTHCNINYNTLFVTKELIATLVAEGIRKPIVVP